MTEDQARWVIGFLLGGLISIIAFALINYSPKKSDPEKIYWAPQPTTQKLLIDGKDSGCLQQGIDDKGYVRWKSVSCAVEKSTSTISQPLTNTKPESKIKP